MSLEENRREYDYGKLSRESLLDNPFDQFSLWMNQAIEARVQDPTAMSVATVSSEGKPWQRMVLLKGFDKKGFVFYTNLGSRKAKEIEANAQVSLHFPWLQLDRQVIIGGRAERLSAVEVVKYFSVAPKKVSWRPGRLSKVVALIPARHWKLSLPKLKRNSPRAMCRCQIFGVAIGWCLRRLSFGRGVRAVCMIALVMVLMGMTGRLVGCRPDPLLFIPST